jgi:hypothetical protein
MCPKAHHSYENTNFIENLIYNEGVVGGREGVEGS